MDQIIGQEIAVLKHPVFFGLLQILKLFEIWMDQTMKKLNTLIWLLFNILIALLIPSTATMAACPPAQPIDFNAYVYDSIIYVGDVDYFSFTLPASGAVAIYGKMDLGEVMEGTLYNSTCTSVLTTGTLVYPYTYFYFPSLPAGTYVLKVEGHYISTLGNYWIYIAYEDPSPSPEIDVKGNSYSITDGDMSPQGADNTLFDYIWGTTHTFTILNTGTAELNLNGTPRVSIGGLHAGDFSVTQQPNSPVAIGGSTMFEVRFQPTGEGLREATISIANDDNNENPYNFAILGDSSFLILFPEIAIIGNGQEIMDGDLTPESFDDTYFGTVDVNTGTVTHTFTIDNSGGAELNLTGTPLVNISGAHASDFSVTVQPNTPVAINGTTLFQVTFTPSAEGLREATISVANDDSNENPYNFTIAGTGVLSAPEITLQGNGQEIIDGDTTPDSADDTDFGMAVVAGSAVIHTFTIANSGTAALNLTGTPIVSVGGIHASDFSVTTQPSSPVGSGDSTTFQVQFAPAAEGLREATVSIANDDSDENPYNFAVGGFGALTEVPEITVSGNGIKILDGDITPNSADGTDFGTAGVAAGVVSNTFTIANSGLAVLNLTGSPRVSINGAHASDFSVTMQPSSPVGSGDSTTFQMQFARTAEGLREATVSIANDDSDEDPYDFAIRGTGSRINPAIVGGLYYSLALEGGDGSLWAWGYNDYGQLGDGTTMDQHTPVFIGSGYSDVSAEYFHVLALKSNGSLWAWGYNDYGQLGDGTTTNRLVPTFIDSGYIAVSAGHGHSLALKSDGSLWAWGHNNYGQLGDGTTTDRHTPVFIGSGYSAIAVGSIHNLALKNDGSLWAWGFNSDGRLGDGTTVNKLEPTLIGNGYSAIAAGGKHSLALKSDGSLWAWGDNYYNQLGDGTNDESVSPRFIETGYSAIAAGNYYSLALKNDSTLWAWGQNNQGQLGDGTMTNRSTPTFIDTGYNAIGPGRTHSLALKKDGSLWAWGENFCGALGDGTTTDRLVPTLIFSEGFTFSTHELVVAIVGDGSSSVTSEPPGIDCGTECRATFSNGSEVSLTPIAEVGSAFVGWSGACSGSEIPCTVTLDATKYVTANFIPQEDTDGDGLSDSLENSGCTDPFDTDTDDDGISDGEEDLNHNGIVDAGETSPCNVDSDRDGIQDGTEVGLTVADVESDTDLNIFVPDQDPFTVTDPTDYDSDGDGISDGLEDENFNGRVDAGESDPNSELDSGDLDLDKDVDGHDLYLMADELYGVPFRGDLDNDGDVDANDLRLFAIRFGRLINL